MKEMYSWLLPKKNCCELCQQHNTMQKSHAGTWKTKHCSFFCKDMIGRQLTTIGFKQDEFSFHVLSCYHKSSESVETAIVSCKNCHNFITEMLYEKPVF